MRHRRESAFPDDALGTRGRRQEKARAQTIIDRCRDTPREHRLPALPWFLPRLDRHRGHLLHPAIRRLRGHSPPPATLRHSLNQPLGGWIIPESPRPERRGAPAALRTGALQFPPPGVYSVLASLVTASFWRQRPSSKLFVSARLFFSVSSSWRRPCAWRPSFCLAWL